MSSVQQAFANSLAPNMVDELLRVLCEVGQKQHAKEIEKIYLRKIDEQVRCEKCSKGKNSQTLS